MEAGNQAATERKPRTSTLCLPSTPPDPSIPASNNESPLGTLAVLPLEIRYEILKMAMDTNGLKLLYQAKPRDFTNRAYPTVRDFCYMPNCDLGLIETSRTIRQEALQVLYTFATFGFNDRFAQPISRSRILLLEHMSNINFHFMIPEDCATQYEVLHQMLPSKYDRDHPYREIIETMPPGFVVFFSGKQRSLRNKITITLQELEENLPLGLLTESPLFHCISQLTSFKQVTLVQVSPLPEVYIMPERRIPAHLITLEQALAPTLGPGDFSELCHCRDKIVSPHCTHWVVQCSVTFRPHAFLSRAEPVG